MESREKGLIAKGQKGAQKQFVLIRVVSWIMTLNVLLNTIHEPTRNGTKKRDESAALKSQSSKDQKNQPPKTNAKDQNVPVLALYSLSGMA